MEEQIYLKKDNEVGELVINRPDKRNALTSAMWEAIPGLVDEAATDSNVKVLLLRGSGSNAFAAGADIAEFPEVYATKDSAGAYNGLIAAAFDSVAHFAKPTIAMVQGVCFGGGCALALACDLRYADPTARFCIPPARLGLVYSLRETKRLVELVGPSKAKEMLMGARVVDAEEALAIGLATRVFSKDVFEDEVRSFVEQLCELSQYSIRSIKTIVDLIGNGVTEDTEETHKLWLAAFDTPDYREGRDAFLEKRKATFTFR